MHNQTNEEFEKRTCTKESGTMHMKSYESELLDRMLTVNEVAYLLHMHPSTVRRWEKQGQLKSCRIGPKSSIRFRREDVANFANFREAQDEDEYGGLAKVVQGCNRERYTQAERGR